MPEFPDEMLTRDRPVVELFEPDERLFRRVPDEFWDDSDIELDAIDFPDMSCTRESLGPPTAARWIGKTYVDWGLIGFRVRDIPEEIPYRGVLRYQLAAEHVPLKQNYPHSEVRVYESPWDEPSVRVHVTDKVMPKIDREAQQKWREKLRRKARIVLRPREELDSPV